MKNKPFVRLVEACTTAAISLWVHRQKMGGPMGYVPQSANEAINRVAGQYPCVGVAVKIGTKFAFHKRSAGGEAAWEHLLEWPDVQLTPGLSDIKLFEALASKCELPTEMVHNRLPILGTTIQWETERGAYCRTERLLVELPTDYDLPDPWQVLTRSDIRNMVDDYRESKHVQMVDYHLAAALWVMERNRPTVQVDLTCYLRGLPIGPMS